MEQQDIPSGRAPDPAVGVATPVIKRQLDIRFTGSGSEYFRIWIVNVLLTIVTLSLYWPFAKARRIRYFYANTLVDGHALSFHGDAWKMFRGHLLLLVLVLSYSVAGHFSPIAGALAFCVLAAIWPALWRAGLQFRLGNTAWRGLRLGFNGGLKQAYLPFLPLAIAGMVLVATGAMLGEIAQIDDGVEAEAATGWVSTLSVIAMLFSTIALPWVLARAKRYQHRGYFIAGQQGDIQLNTDRVYGIFVKVLGLWILAVMAMAAVVFVVIAVGNFGESHEASESSSSLLSLIPLLCGYLLYFAVLTPLFTARLQNLVWNGTSSQDLSFTSSLGFGPLFRLTLKNLLLTVLTIGLYRPFAAIHTARLRLESVGVTVTGDVETWVADASAAHQDAAGEIAGDFFGIDMGL